ncbi:MAG: DNA helicase UvrD [Pseudomonadales bacterium]
MDKRVIFAVAGAGKTTHIINSLSLDKHSLIVTYTENNYHHLRHKVIQKFGVMPENITLLTYFTFLYSFCYKPFLHYKYGAKGINWDTPPSFTLRLNRSDKRFYVDIFKRLYSNRIAKLVEQDNVLDHVKARLSKYYDEFFIDEVQDFGGHDFNLLKTLCDADLNICLVGDFYQHTFDTSRDGNVNKSLYDDFEAYRTHFQDVGVVPDTTTLSHSYRCTPQVCEFITENLGIDIQSHKKTSSEVLFIDDEEKIEEKYSCNETIKLFYQNHIKYLCFSQNWGKSKGQDHYIDVCIMLYPVAMKAYEAGDLKSLTASSKNKLYVACTRANCNIFFVEEKKVKHHKG